MIQLDLMIVVPLVMAVVAAVSGARSPGLARLAGLAAPLMQLLLLLSLAGAGIFQGERLVGADLGRFGYVWSLITDGLSTPLLVLTALVGLMAVSASWNIDRRPGAHFALLALLQAAVAAVFLADSLVLFYVAWESVLVPMFLLIGGWGSSGARRAAMKFLVFTFAGGAVLLAGVVMCLILGQGASISTLSALRGFTADQGLLFWLLAIGFLVKVPAVPLHTWLPDAHTEAPTAGSIVLAGVLLKMGGYGLVRIAAPFAPQGYEKAVPVLFAIGLVGIVWGAATALVQADLKRLVAYSSVAHMGFVLVAVAVGTPDALAAAVVTMVSHGLVAGLLFYLVGGLYGRAHTRELSRFGGLGSIAPRWSVAFVFASLASAGLPGLSGFPGEFVTVLEAFSAIEWWTLVAGVGIVLAAAYNLRAVRGTVQGPIGSFAKLPDLDSRETATAALTALAIVVLGVAPWIVTAMGSRTFESIARLLGRGSL